MKYITLLTDFGLKDGYVGVMKGVIWGICPGVQIADITHSVSPQNVLEGAIVLERTAPIFPGRYGACRGGGPRCGHPAPPHCCPPGRAVFCGS